MTFKTLERQKDALDPPAKPSYPELQKIALPHIQSFNSLFPSKGRVGLLETAIADIPKCVVFDGESSMLVQERSKVEFWLSEPSLAKPVSNVLVYPSECRERGTSYQAAFSIKLNWRINGGPTVSEIRPLGNLPVMVKVCFME